MELKVWVEGIQRVVCGVCDRTTCQDVVYALAHATGKTGRFTLIERWRNNERLLAPHEHPLKVLMKWGEYSSDVHFILQRTALDTTARNSMQQQQQQNNKSATSRPTKTSVDPLHGFTPPLTSPPPSSNVGAVASIVTASPSKDLKKSLTFSGGGRAGSPNEQRSRHPLNVGVVRGVPKRLENGDDHQQQTHGPQPNGRLDWPSDKSPQVPAPPPPPPPPLLSHYQDNPSSNEEQLVYPRYDPPYGRVRLPLGSNGSSGGGEIPTGLHYSNPSPGAALSNQQDSFQSDLVRFPPPYRNPPPPSSGGSRQPPPPPYREPPRPSPVGGGRGTSSSPYRSSPAPPMTPSPGRSTTSTPSRPSPIRYCEMNVQQQQQQQQQLTDDSYNAVPSPLDSRGDGSRRSRRNLRLELSGVRTPSPPSDPHQAQLIQRVNRQRGDLDGQQERLVQLEQELLKWEERVQRQLDEERRQLDCELTQLEGRCRDQENQLSDLFDVEAECERTCREGEELTQELARWRTDVSALDLQLDQCEPTLSRLKVDLNQAEERLTCELEQELTRVKSDLDAAGQQEHNMNEEDEIISQDLLQSEAQVRSLRTQMDQLTQEIKQANLQSLSIAPTDDLKILLEGHSKTGHSRRMLGSPRQLENPVPTNKNPHGVWV